MSDLFFENRKSEKKWNQTSIWYVTAKSQQVTNYTVFSIATGVYFLGILVLTNFAW